MSKISQQTADRLTKILLSKKEIARNKSGLEFRKAVESAYVKTIPADVMKFYKKNPKFTRTTMQVQMIGGGFNHEYVTLIDSQPAEHYRSTTIFSPEGPVADALKKLHNESKTLTDQYDALKSETYNALISLGTSKRIIESFPELAKYLEVATTALIVNVTDLKKRINALPSPQPNQFTSK